MPLTRSDVDTDQIIPTDWLKRVERTGFGQGLFSEWRDDRDFVLNDERYVGATDPRRRARTSASARRASTPCGRSRTTASTSSSRPASATSSATTRTKNGLVPVVLLDADVVERLHAAIEADPTLEIIVDVERLVVEVPEPRHRRVVPARRRRPSTGSCNGLDDIGITLTHEADITAYEQTRPAWLPSVS